MVTGGSKIPLKTSNINMAYNHWDHIEERFIMVPSLCHSIIMKFRYWDF